GLQLGKARRVDVSNGGREADLAVASGGQTIRVIGCDNAHDWCSFSGLVSAFGVAVGMCRLGVSGRGRPCPSVAGRSVILKPHASAARLRRYSFSPFGPMHSTIGFGSVMWCS